MKNSSLMSKAASILGSAKSEAKTIAVRANGAKSRWRYKVVKKQYDLQGKWISYPAAATFESVEMAIDYAREFAAEQRRAKVIGTRIVVENRGSKPFFEARVGLNSHSSPNGETRFDAQDNFPSTTYEKTA